MISWWCLPFSHKILKFQFEGYSRVVSLSLFVFLEWEEISFVREDICAAALQQPGASSSTAKSPRFLERRDENHVRPTQNLRTSLEKVRRRRKKCLIRVVLDSTQYQITKWRSNNVCASVRRLRSNKKKLKITKTKLVELESRGSSRKIWQGV